MQGTYYETTPGKWELVPGEPGFSGSREEPPEPSYPPSIVANTERGEIEIAQLTPTHPPDARVDLETGEAEYLGDPEANGHLMASAPRLKSQLHAVLALARLHFANTQTPPHALLANVMAESYRLLDELEKRHGPSRLGR